MGQMVVDPVEDGTSICNAKKYVKRIINPYTLGHSDYKSEWTGNAGLFMIII